MDRGDWRATVRGFADPWVCRSLDTTEATQHITKKLYSTGNSTQYSVMVYMTKEQVDIYV